MQVHHTRTIIATARARDEADDRELDYLDGLIQGGGDEFVEHLVGHWNDALTCDGIDERVQQKALNRAGFATAFRY